MKIKTFFLLIMVTFASEKKENDADNLILVKIEEDEYTKVHKKTSQYIGVSYIKDKIANWHASRRSKNENKTVNNGSYKDEVTAAHASDTLARKLMKNGEQNHKLNFPDDDTEVSPEKQILSSIYIGVTYHKKENLWIAQRGGKHEEKVIYNGSYKDEETAAHASDTLARKLMENGESKLKLNFPDDNTEVNAKKKTSEYIGVTYCKSKSRWRAYRRSKNEKKLIHNGTYKDEETAAHASDTLARELMENGEQNRKLNFPDDDIKCQTNKRKRSDHEDLGNSKNK